MADRILGVCNELIAEDKNGTQHFSKVRTNKQIRH